ncbi:MAG: hypothetical protein BroJett040_05530 [Oligoflexia bacterium]|nr:MAG: hypothetical protein BroJett040_05530 [Oligoflexia bacterium]
MIWWRKSFAALVLVGVSGCVIAPPPVEEFTLARAALDSAKAVEAARHSPGFYHQAEESYRRGKALYEDRDYETAKIEFLKAKQAAEKAENSARMIRFKNGEVL